MAMRSSILVAFVWIVSALAIPTAPASPRVRRVIREAVPRGWSLHRRADPDALLPLKFALVQSNLLHLESYLLDIADPESPNYGKHWSISRVAKTFRASPQSVDVVHSWLSNDAEIDGLRIKLAPDGGALHLNVTVAEAERILGAEYHVYRHNEDGSERVGCRLGYQLPDHVSKHIDFVWPTTHLGDHRLLRKYVKRSSERRGVSQRPNIAQEVCPHLADTLCSFITMAFSRHLPGVYLLARMVAMKM